MQVDTQKGKLEKVKLFFDIISSIVTIAALIIGGIWTYKIFIQERKHYPHVKIEQKVSHINLSNNGDILIADINMR